MAVCSVGTAFHNAQEIREGWRALDLKVGGSVSLHHAEKQAGHVPRQDHLMIQKASLLWLLKIWASHFRKLATAIDWMSSPPIVSIAQT